MYLKSFKMQNYRKFGNEDNVVEFVTPNKNKETQANKEKTLSEATTLIVGKNNSGKTTVTTALEKILKNDSNLKYSDFNLKYLNSSLEANKVPFLEFSLVIELDDKKATIHRIMPFMPLKGKNQEIIINIRYSVENEETFKNKLEELKKSIDKANNKKFTRLEEITEKVEVAEELKKIEEKYKRDIKKIQNKFYDLVDKTKFIKIIYNENWKKIEGVKLENLINFKIIKADKNINGGNLSSAFNRIFNSNFMKERVDIEKIDAQLEEISEGMSNELLDHYKSDAEKVSSALMDNGKTGFNLTCNLSADSLFESIIKYEYREGEYLIPESQFGLGYTNLMLIIAQLIEYLEKEYKYEQKDVINIICIEEPEVFMHTELQKIFIQNIADTISKIVEKRSNISFQIIITTHSPYIVQSKIRLADSFDDINYFDNQGRIITLKDNMVIDKNREDLKYITVNVSTEYSEIFFSDAVIVVEGIAEKALLPRFIEKTDLKNKNISIFNISGAHAHKFRKLFECLKIPIVIITDLDIKSEEDDQIRDLLSRTTSNAALKDFFGTDNLKEIISKNFEIASNIYIATQKEKVEGCYATSFEEALILINENNEKLKEILEKIRPKVCQSGIELKDNSKKIQNSLSHSSGKAILAAKLNYEFITNDKFEFKIPLYIEEGLNFILKKLNQ